MSVTEVGFQAGFESWHVQETGQKLDRLNQDEQISSLLLSYVERRIRMGEYKSI